MNSETPSTEHSFEKDNEHAAQSNTKLYCKETEIKTDEMCSIIEYKYLQNGVLPCNIQTRKILSQTLLSTHLLM